MIRAVSRSMAGRIILSCPRIMPSLRPQRKAGRTRLRHPHPPQRRSLRLFTVPAGGFADQRD
jgi:hypothetical protein